MKVPSFLALSLAASLSWSAAWLVSGAEGSWEEVGGIGVDSGQVAILDPAYIDSEWVAKGEGTNWTVEFWGRDEGRIAAKFGKSPIACEDEDNAKELGLGIGRYCKSSGSVVQWDLKSGSSYDLCSELTLSSKGHGQLMFQAGHAGLGVVSSTAYGDGTFPVYARRNEDGIITELRVMFDKDGAEAKRLRALVK